MKQFWKEWYGLIIAGLLIFLIMFSCIGFSLFTELSKCALYDSTSINHEWLFFGGCRVQTPEGYWIHVDEVVPVEFFDSKGIRKK